MKFFISVTYNRPQKTLALADFHAGKQTSNGKLWINERGGPSLKYEIFERVKYVNKSSLVEIM